MAAVYLEPRQVVVDDAPQSLYVTDADRRQPGLACVYPHKQERVEPPADMLSPRPWQPLLMAARA